MKKLMMLMVLCMTGLVMMAGVSWSEEAAWYDAAEDWIVRAYTAPAGPDYSVTLEVLTTGNVLVTDPILGLANNPHQIIGNAGGPDVSLAFDEATATAYVLYTTPGGGAVSLQEIPDLVRAHGVMTVAPNPLLFGNVWVLAIYPPSTQQLLKQYYPNAGSVTKTVTVSNTGNAPVTITSFIPPGGPFSVAAGTTCAVGAPMGAGVSCSIVVKFEPLAYQAYTSSFTINSNAGNVTVNLSGTGSASPY